MSLATTTNFNATTPAPATGRQNIVFADDAGSPTVNISATDPLMVGDSGSGGTAGNVPAPGAGTAAAGKYLKADGTWEVPPGTGLTNPMTTEGDIIYGGASGTPTRLAPGTAGDVLQTNGSGAAPSWVPAGGGGSVPIALNWPLNPATTTATNMTLGAIHAGAITQCSVTVTAADASTALTFNITHNGTSVFSSAPSLAGGTSANSYHTFSLTSGSLTVSAGDIFEISVSSGSSSWIASVVLH